MTPAPAPAAAPLRLLRTKLAREDSSQVASSESPALLSSLRSDTSGPSTLQLVLRPLSDAFPLWVACSPLDTTGICPQRELPPRCWRTRVLRSPARTSARLQAFQSPSSPHQAAWLSWQHKTLHPRSPSRSPTTLTSITGSTSPGISATGLPGSASCSPTSVHRNRAPQTTFDGTPSTTRVKPLQSSAPPRIRADL